MLTGKCPISGHTSLGLRLNFHMHGLDRLWKTRASPWGIEGEWGGRRGQGKGQGQGECFTSLHACSWRHLDIFPTGETSLLHHWSGFVFSSRSSSSSVLQFFLLFFSGSGQQVWTQWLTDWLIDFGLFDWLIDWWLPQAEQVKIDTREQTTSDTERGKHLLHLSLGTSLHSPLENPKNV